MTALAERAEVFLAQMRIAVAGAVNPGGCPLMFGTTSDFGHRCMRWIMRVGGRLAA